MTDLRKAAERALEALEAVNEMSKPPMGIPLPAEIDGAMDALRQALDHVPDTMKMLEPDMGIDRGAWDDVPDATKWVDELRGGDETEQEPVAWMTNSEQDTTAEYMFCHVQTPMHDIPLYEAPPSKPWVSLTDEEINQAANNAGFGHINIAREIEAALKEKNT